jgi:hypothetical protein
MALKPAGQNRERAAKHRMIILLKMGHSIPRGEWWCGCVNRGAAETQRNKKRDRE